MSFFRDLQTYFKTQDLYEILGVLHDASDSQIKSAYKRAALCYHPDKVEKDKKILATTCFQLLTNVYQILINQDKRQLYDQTGSVSEDDLTYENNDWEEYFQRLFPNITGTDIDVFMVKYKGSDEEIEDLKHCYLRFEGDMDKISQTFIGYNIDEEENIANMLKEMINRQEIPEFAQFTREHSSKRNARMKRYLKEAKAAASVSLTDVIKQRSKRRKEEFNNMIRNIQAKYCPNQPKKKRAQYKRIASGTAKMETKKISRELSIREKRRKEFTDMIKAIERKYVKNIKRKNEY